MTIVHDLTGLGPSADGEDSNATVKLRLVRHRLVHDLTPAPQPTRTNKPVQI